VPIAGPFITMVTVDASASGAGMLVADGLAQIGGVIGIVVGAVDRRYKIVRHAGVELELAPGPALGGLSLKGSF
jgi:hypothetical protein